MKTATLDRATSSAVPEARIPFATLLRVEWAKATDTRAARWLIGITVAATVLIMLVPLLATKTIDQTYDSYLQFSPVGLTTLLPVVCILTLTTEWTQRTVLTTFTQEPRRSRVVSAKVAVAGLIGLAAIVLGFAVTAASLGISSLAGRQLSNDLDAGNVIGFVLFVLVNILMGVAFGALLHNTAAAIVAFFVVPALFGLVGVAVEPVGRWLDPSTIFNWMLEGKWGGHGAQLAVSVLLWLLLPLAAGVIRTARREIK